MRPNAIGRTGRLCRDHGGFTLVEVIVVLILLTLAAALVAPAFIFRERGPESGLASVISNAQELAVRRGETLYLQLDGTGRWTVVGAASPSEGIIAEGHLDTGESLPAFTLVLGPLGSCGFDTRSGAAARLIPIDPLACRLGT